MKEIDAIKQALSAGPTPAGTLPWPLINACNPAAMEAVLAHIDAQAAEIERLKGNADAAIVYCPTCSQGVTASAKMTRDEVIFHCGRASARLERDILKAEIERLRELADSEGSRAVKYLRRARTAEAEIEMLRAHAERLEKKYGDLVTEIERLRGAATALLGSADWRVAGCWSDKSPRKDLPSNAVSTVKTRHLAGLRDAAMKETP